MIKREAQFQVHFGRWVKENADQFGESSGFELKYEKNNTFNVKQWLSKSPHQARSLLECQTPQGVFHKISDMSAGMKPFDCFLLKEATGYLVIYWEKQRDFTINKIENVQPFFSGGMPYQESLKINEKS